MTRKKKTKIENFEHNNHVSHRDDGVGFLKYKILVWCGFVLSLLIFAFLVVADIKLALGWLGAVLLFVWFWLDIRWGLWMLIISIVFGQIVKIELGGGGLLLTDGVMVVLVTVWILRNILYRPRVNWNVLIWWLVLFLATGTMINIWWSHDYGSMVSWKMWLYWIRLIIYSSALPITWSVVFWDKNWRKWCQVFLWSGAFFLILGLIQLKLLPDISFLTQFGWDPHQGRLLSTFLDPNFAGAYLILMASLSLAFYLSIDNWTKTKLFYGVLSGLFLFGIILTLSRSALLAVAIVFAIMTLWQDRRIFILGIFLGALLVLNNPRLAERLHGIYKVDETAQLRINSWEDNFEIAKDNYWIGVGYNAMAEEQYRRGVIENTSVHSAGGSDSSYITIWSTLGIVGLGVVWILYGLFLGLAWKIYLNHKFDIGYRYFALGVMGGIMGVLVHAQFTNSLFYPHIFIPVLILMGIVMGSGKVKNSKFKVQN